MSLLEQASLESVDTVFMRALTNNRLPQSILLHGTQMDCLEEECFKMARTILSAPTGRGPFQHPDLFCVRPENKMRQISVDTIRALIEEIQQTPYVGQKKVAIVLEVDRMNAAAANAFLKTLEEPPADTIILSTTTQLYSVLPTILSRCVQYRIKGAVIANTHPEWLEWKRSFADWLDQMMQFNYKPPTKTAVARTTLAAYQLIAGFETFFKQMSADADEDLADEQSDSAVSEAARVAAAKGLRHNLFVEIESVTRDLMLPHIGRMSPYKYDSIVRQLEYVYGLFAVNLNELVGLEFFFIHIIKTVCKHN